MELRKIYSFCFLCIFCISCSKYPDNDRIYLESSKSRLKSHTWKLNYLSVNSYDSTYSHLSHMIPTSSNKGDFSFDIKGMDYDTNDGIYTLSFTGNNSQQMEAKVTISDDKKKITFSPIFYSPYSNSIANPNITNSALWVPYRQEWSIKKLTDECLVITCDYNGNDVKFEFVK